MFGGRGCVGLQAVGLGAGVPQGVGRAGRVGALCRRALWGCAMMHVGAGR